MRKQAKLYDVIKLKSDVYVQIIREQNIFYFTLIIEPVSNSL